MKIPVRPILSVSLLVGLLGACQPAARATPAPEPSSPATTTTATPAAPKQPSLEVQPPPAGGPTRATLAVGGSATIANGRLRLLRVVNDSRCPKDAQCIWEGEVTLAFDFNNGSGNTEFEVSQRRNPTATVGERSFTLKDYGPCGGSKQDAAKECATVVLGAALTH